MILVRIIKRVFAWNLLQYWDGLAICVEKMANINIYLLKSTEQHIRTKPGSPIGLSVVIGWRVEISEVL